jgi:hypothetical protein
MAQSKKRGFKPVRRPFKPASPILGKAETEELHRQLENHMLIVKDSNLRPISNEQLTSYEEK